MLAMALPATGYSWVTAGFTEAHPKISGDPQLLQGFRPSLHYFLNSAELHSQGQKLSRRLVQRFPVVIHRSHPVKGCSVPGKTKAMPGCDTPFASWSEVEKTLQRTPVPGVEIYTPYFDETRKYRTDMIIGLREDQLITIDSPERVILSLSDSFLRASSGFESKAGAFHFRIGAYLGAARTFDGFLGNKPALRKCDLAYGACDVFRDGPLVQTAAYYLTAANECGGCTSKDKAVLFNMGIRVLTGTQPDAKLDAVELHKQYQSIIQKTIVPEALIKRLRDKQLLMVGMSPRLDD